MLALFCTAMPRRVYDAVGPLDERFGIGLFEDDDYNRRVREKGYAVRCARDAFVHHWQMASFRRMSKEAYFALYAENKRKYDEKWSGAPASPAAPAPASTRRFATLEEHRDQLSHVLARVRSSKGAVVFLPSVGWGIHLFQRPHHLARVFARLGYVAIFDSSNAADRVDGFREIEPNLFLFSGSPGAAARSAVAAALGVSLQLPSRRRLPEAGADGLRLDRRPLGLPVRRRAAPAQSCPRPGRGDGRRERRPAAPRGGPDVAARRRPAAQRRRVRALRRARRPAPRRGAPALPGARGPRRRVLRRAGGVVRLPAARRRGRRPARLAVRAHRPAVRQEPPGPAAARAEERALARRRATT